MIDEYARGELPAQERANFERLFFVNPERRQRVEFATALSLVSSRDDSTPSIINSERTRTFSDVFTSLFPRPRPALTYATVVIAATVLIGTWWALTKTGAPGEIAKHPALGTEQVTPGQIAKGPSPEATTQTQPPDIAHKEGSQPYSNGRLADANRKARVGISHAEGTVATFILLPGLTRDSGERTRLVIPNGRQIVRFKVELEEHDAVSYRSYTAELSRANSEKTWASGVLSKKNRTLILNIPVSSLPAKKADYDLTLRGQVAPGRVSETLAYYYLTIVRE